MSINAQLDDNYQDKLDWLLWKNNKEKSSDKPYPVVSNWPNKEGAPKKDLPDSLWFVDIDGHSVATAKSLSAIRELLKLFPGGDIRCYCPTQEDIDEQQAEAREEKRYQNCF